MITCSVTPAASLQSTVADMLVGGTDKPIETKFTHLTFFQSVTILLKSVHSGRLCNLENTCTEKLGDSLPLR